MLKNLKYFRQIMPIFVILVISSNAKAQLTLMGQIRTRSEFRDGAGTLRLKVNSPSIFTSQRSRLIFNYKLPHVIFQMSLQDVRVWGQDASTLSGNDGSKLGLHEAWAEIALANKKDTSFKHSPVDYFAVKIGRQELVYDDSRLLGNLDWAQAARRHDAVVFKLLNKGLQFDLGIAFNQNSDAFNYNGTFYTPANVMPYVKDSRGNLSNTPTSFIPLSNAAGISSKAGSPALQAMPSTNGLNQNYKALEYFYAAKVFNKTKVSALMLADHFGKYINDSVKNIAGSDTGYIYGKRFNQKGINSRVTTGFMINSSLGKKQTYLLSAAFYYQTGKDRDGLNLGGFTTTTSVAWIKNKMTYTIGYDYVSGNDAFSSSTTNYRFDPLYGTPHKFWGLMDYFYVATGSPAGGLSNPFAKFQYGSKNKRLTSQIDYHYLSLAKNQKNTGGTAIKKYLGSEVDFVTTYALNKITTLEFGFSVMAASNSMEYAKNIIPDSAKLTGVWSYLMFTIKPAFLFK